MAFALLPDLLPDLIRDAVHIWHRPLDLTESDLRRCESVLSAEEADRAGRYTFAKGRDHFVAARGMLRLLLSHYTQLRPEDLVFAYGEKGKPELADGQADVCFNVSHASGFAAWAFARNRKIGVDIEWRHRRANISAIGKRFFSDVEWTALCDLPEDRLREGFFRCWTRKEAFVKALGDGLTYSLKAFDVSVGARAELLRVEGEHCPPHWTLGSLENLPADYIGAVAFQGQAAVLSRSLALAS
ncbi:MAG: 4'-phosphopantetheinyl transferase superfamily protein [bacterium]|nr:4'-phosphopantetheinyl transferase superfamily protein [bacterium]